MLSLREIGWRRVWDSNPRDIAVKRFSRPPRYDRFDNPPCFIELSDVLLILCATICVVFSNVRCILYHILLILSRDIFQFVVFCCVSFVSFILYFHGTSRRKLYHYASAPRFYPNLILPFILFFIPGYSSDISS